MSRTELRAQAAVHLELYLYTRDHFPMTRTELRAQGHRFSWTRSARLADLQGGQLLKSPQVPQVEPAVVKAELPAQAQRMSSLLAADKEVVYCRVERRTHGAGLDAGRDRLEGVGQRRAQAARARGGPDWRAGGRARAAERTENMSLISVTLDVSKLTSWLNTPPRSTESKKGTGWEREGVRSDTRSGTGDEKAWG